jgi:hypothetical protein
VLQFHKKLLSSRHDDQYPPTSGVQLIEVAPELPANASTISSSRLKGVPKT